MTTKHELASLQYLKEQAPESYIACLYLPEACRYDAAAIYSFESEIRRIPRLVSEPMPGELRIQWWKDQVAGKVTDGSGPIASALLETIKRKDLQPEVFWNYLDAKIFDLYNDPMPDVETLEGYLGETESSILNQVAICSGMKQGTDLADACGHGGVAIGLARILAVLPHHKREQKTYIPVSILKTNDLDVPSWLGDGVDERHFAVVEQVLELAEEHMRKSREAIARLQLESNVVFLPLSFASCRISAVRRAGKTALKTPTQVSLFRLHLSAFKVALTGKI